MRVERLLPGTWRIAYRLRWTALSASPLPFLLMVATDGIEHSLQSGLPTLTVHYLLVDVAYFPADALFIGMLLEASFARGTPPLGRAALLPSISALKFAAIVVPLGLAAVLLHLGIRSGNAELTMYLFADSAVSEPHPLWRFVTMLVIDPDLQMVLAGLVLAPIAVRVLHLQELTTAVRTTPDLRLAGMLVVALAVAQVLSRGVSGMLEQVPGLEETIVPFYAGWYVGVVTMLSLTAAAIAALLVRRARHASAS